MRGVAESIGNTVFGALGRVMARTQEKRSLPVDLLESDDAYLAIFDAPGAESTDVTVRFENGEISARIDRYRDPRDEFEMAVPGRGLALSGAASLPAEAVVDPEGASATLRADGTLHVRVPKAESAGEADDVEVSEADE
jgi:HSP20 family molecular chaperone IbpA